MIAEIDYSRLFEIFIYYRMKYVATLPAFGYPAILLLNGALKQT